MKFVFDTNTIVSALLLPDSKPRQAMDRAQDRGKILISMPALLELNEVIARKKFDKYLSEEKRKEFLAALVKQAEFLEVNEVEMFFATSGMRNRCPTVQGHPGR